MAYDAKKRAEEINGGAVETEKVSKVPPKEEMVTMSKSELKDLMGEIKSDFAEQIKNAEDRYEKLKLTYERDDAIHQVKNKGEFADTSVKIRQLGPLGPIDHQQRAIQTAGVDDKLKGKAARFVNTNAELTSLRRSQGYEPVLDKKGNEVRYMDGVLMAMPQDRYDKEIIEPTRIRKEIHKAAIGQDFKETAAKNRVETFGDGIQYDGGNG
jgi:hypothetical protein